MNSALETEVLQLHAEICAGLADPNRIMILYELSSGSKNVSELCANLNMPQPILKERIIAAAQAGFLPNNEKEDLVSQLKNELKM